MSKQDIIVIGASAGGIEACNEVLKALDADLAATIYIVVHISATAPSVLPRIFGRHTRLTVKNPEDGEVPKNGFVYVAPSNKHLLLKPDLIRLGRGPRENGCRPSVDALFRTAAFSYGARVIGVILSGALSDGTAGLMSIKANGGTAIVQKPEDANFPGMPNSALEFVSVDHLLTAAEIGRKLNELVGNNVDGHIDKTKADQEELKHQKGTAGLRNGMEGASSNLTCPSCGGALWESLDKSFPEFRCHVGHSFSAQSLLQEQSDAIDNTFWRTLRQLEENIALRKKMIAIAREKNKASEVEVHEEQIALADRQAQKIREALLTDVPRLSDPESAPGQP